MTDQLKENPKKEQVAFQVRIPNALNEELMRDASKNKRTKNEQIEWILEQHINKVAAQELSQV